MKLTPGLCASVGGAAIFGWMFFRSYREKKGHEKCLRRIKDRISEEGIQLGPEQTYFCGFESKGFHQPRDLGTLVLTQQGNLQFEATGKHSLSLTREQVVKAEAIPGTACRIKDTRPQILQKLQNPVLPDPRKPLLRIEFKTDGNEREGAVWLVRDPEIWAYSINLAVA